MRPLQSSYSLGAKVVEFRNVREEDFLPIIRVIDDWWGGRHMADMLPRLFFVHFQDTSFVVTDGGRIVGFLVGFVSQTHPSQAYIHFVGIHPDYRKQGLGNYIAAEYFEAPGSGHEQR